MTTAVQDVTHRKASRLSERSGAGGGRQGVEGKATVRGDTEQLSKGSGGLS